MMVSALTMLELDEMWTRDATYPNLGDVIRERFVDPGAYLRERFGRIVFNILVGNTDDYVRILSKKDSDIKPGLPEHRLSVRGVTFLP